MKKLWEKGRKRTRKPETKGETKVRLKNLQYEESEFIDLNIKGVKFRFIKE